jgi:hypothetical protein
MAANARGSRCGVSPTKLSAAAERAASAAGREPDELESKNYEPKHRARMRTANGHDHGAHEFSADPNLDHFTVARFSGLVLCLGKLEFRAAGLSRFDVPDVLTRHLFNPLNDMHANGRGKNDTNMIGARTRKTRK